MIAPKSKWTVFFFYWTAFFAAHDWFYELYWGFAIQVICGLFVIVNGTRATPAREEN